MTVMFTFFWLKPGAEEVKRWKTKNFQGEKERN